MVIDSIVRCGDWFQDKEKIKHVLDVSERLAIAGVFDDVSYASPPVISSDVCELRLDKAAESDSPVVYNLIVGLTPEPEQVKDMVYCHIEDSLKQKTRQKVVGLKMNARISSYDHLDRRLELLHPRDQLTVFRALAYSSFKGVLVVDCEGGYPQNTKFDIENIIINAIKGGYKQAMHISPVTTPESVRTIQRLKNQFSKLSCGTFPQYLLLDNNPKSKGNENNYKILPPLRDQESKEGLLECFKSGEIDVLASGHAPPDFPALASWLDVFELLKQREVTQEVLDATTHDNVNRIFGTNIPRIEKTPSLTEGNDKDYYEVDLYAHLLKK
jgi:dihydroorotase-like cyclic amidohydrolase